MTSGMNDYGPSTYGDRIADAYDDIFGGTLAPSESQIDRLAQLAGDGRALELGIGTGRVALPLKARGVEVHGIDVSDAMVAKLRAKEGGAEVPVTVGDFADVAVDGQFSLVFVVFNTFFGILTQEDQVRCFGNVAAYLTQGGAFLIEAFVPDLARFDRGQRVSTSEVETDRVRIDLARHDAAKQQVTSQHLHISETDTRLYPVRIRYAWPSELDLMAQLAGMRLRERWSDWDRSPFKASSGNHISVYERG